MRELASPLNKESAVFNLEECFHQNFTVISAFHPLGLWEISGFHKPPILQYFAIAAWTKHGTILDAVRGKTQCTYHKYATKT